MISELCLLVEGLTRTVNGEGMQVAHLVDVELWKVCLVITAALSESEGTVDDAIADVRDCFPIEAFCGVPGPSAGGSSGQP